jgi:hypothetical protein
MAEIWNNCFSRPGKEMTETISIVLTLEIASYSASLTAGAHLHG